MTDQKKDMFLDGSKLLIKILEVLSFEKKELLTLILLKSDIKIIKNDDDSIELEFIANSGNREQDFVIDLLIKTIFENEQVELSDVKKDLDLLFNQINEKVI